MVARMTISEKVLLTAFWTLVAGFFAIQFAREKLGSSKFMSACEVLTVFLLLAAGFFAFPF